MRTIITMVATLFSRLVSANELYRASSAGDKGTYYILETENLGNNIIRVLSSRIAVELYAGIIKLRTDWHDDNKSAKEVLGDDALRELARVLVEKVKANTSIDWTIKESVQAKLRVIVKRILRRYGYPPDQQKLATRDILQQAELFADEWSTKSVV